MATREPPKPLKPQFSAAASRTQNIKVPPEIKNHKPAPVPKPPGSVAASVQKQVREQNAVRNSQSVSATKQATQTPRQSFSTTQKFNSQSNSLTHQFNTKARGR